jgi:hypothetical protein
MRSAVLLAALLLLAGCDSAKPSGAAGMAKSEEINRTAVGFSQCMRDHGHQVPDPTFDEDGLPTFAEPENGREDPAYGTDRQQCRVPLNEALVAAGVPNRKGTPDQWLAFARCMREHGVEMPDPTPERPIPFSDRNAFDSPAWQPAVQACESNVPPSMREILRQLPGTKGGGK